MDEITLDPLTHTTLFDIVWQNSYPILLVFHTLFAYSRKIKDWTTKVSTYGRYTIRCIAWVWQPTAFSSSFGLKKCQPDVDGVAVSCDLA